MAAAAAAAVAAAAVAAAAMAAAAAARPEAKATAAPAYCCCCSCHSHCRRRRRGRRRRCRRRRLPPSPPPLKLAAVVATAAKRRQQCRCLNPILNQTKRDQTPALHTRYACVACMQGVTQAKVSVGGDGLGAQVLSACRSQCREATKLRGGRPTAPLPLLLVGQARDRREQARKRGEWSRSSTMGRPSKQKLIDAVGAKSSEWPRHASKVEPVTGQAITLSLADGGGSSDEAVLGKRLREDVDEEDAESVAEKHAAEALEVASMTPASMTASVSVRSQPCQRAPPTLHTPHPVGRAAIPLTPNSSARGR